MESSQSLRAGSVLHDSYRIERTLGQGGFGITYLAYDLTLGINVAIKEFFPKNLVNRDGATSHVAASTTDNAKLADAFKAKFLKEARSIARLKHPNIIRVLTAFEANGTAYYVMELIEGSSLADMVRTAGPLTEACAVDYITKVGHALEYLHERHMNHLDVKPANIMVRRADNCPILIDFGLSKQYDEEGLQTSTTPVGLSHGFAPAEQYEAGGVSEFSPAVDVYSLAATLYYLLSGIVPLSSLKLVSEPLPFPDSIPERLVGPIEKAMSPARVNRYQSVGEFLETIALPAATADDEATTFAHEGSDDKKVQKPNVGKPASWVKLVLGVAAVAVMGVGGYALLKPQKTVIPEPNIQETVYADTLLTQDSISLTAQAPTTQQKADSEPKANMKDEAAADKPQKADPEPKANMKDEAAADKPQKAADYDKKSTFTVEKNSRGATYTVNGVSFDMIEVNGGTFIMGSDADDAPFIEHYAHKVTLSSFSIGKTEVTQALWKAVMGSNPSKFKGDNLPVESVTWDKCQTFIQKLNQLTGMQFRLPTEAEWEFAARGGNRSKGYTYAGSNNLGEVAWYYANSNDRTHQVATKRPNELGLYDMTGNVEEWCQDYVSACYPSEDVTNPKGLSKGTDAHVARGYYYFGESGTESDLQITRRSFVRTYDFFSGLGLRLAL